MMNYADEIIRQHVVRLTTDIDTLDDQLELMREQIQQQNVMRDLAIRNRDELLKELAQRGVMVNSRGDLVPAPAGGA